MKNPRIVNLIDFFEENRKAYLILEYVPKGNLFGVMRENDKLSKNWIRRIFCDTLLALKFLHSEGIILRDLKPENMLIDSDNRIKSKLKLKLKSNFKSL